MGSVPIENIAECNRCGVCGPTSEERHSCGRLRRIELPRESRFGANSSVLQQKGEAAQLTDDARKLKELLEETMCKNGLITADDAVENVSQLIAKMYEQFTHSPNPGEHELLVFLAGTSQISPTQLQGSPGTAVLAMYITVRVFVQLLKKNKK